MKRLWIFVPIFILTTILLTGCNKIPEVDNLALQEELQEQIDVMEAQEDDISIHAWVKDLNINAPVWMKLNEDISSQTTEDVEWFNSIHFVYEWDYDTAMEQAEKIANDAGISMSVEFQMAQDMIDSMGIDNIQMEELMWDLKWAVYTNYTLTEKPDYDYMIAITVNEDGSLEIDVTDVVTMQEIAEQHTK